MRKKFDEMQGQLNEVGGIAYMMRAEAFGSDNAISEAQMNGFIDGIATACTAFGAIASGAIDYQGPFEFVRCVSGAYLELAREYPERFVS
jgi:hypothetical protein